ncbi:MAG: flavin reductase [Gammaproteobacteria bacterium]|nr:flavin reductase [Gammaproteobacteria bacterium]
MSTDPGDLRRAFGTFATGVTIVTARSPAGQDVGLTVNSFSSVSLDPPMVLWSLAKTSGSRSTFMETDSFAVHILAQEQAGLAASFAQRGVDKFAGLELGRGVGYVPLLGECSARFQCRTVFRFDGGDHDIVGGEIVAYEHFDRAPLVFLSGRYAVAVEHPEAEPATEDEEPFATSTLISLQYLVAKVHYECQLALRPELARAELTEVEFYLLAVVAMAGPCAEDCLLRRVATSGAAVSGANIDHLVHSGLLLRRGSAQEGVRMTPEGSRILMRLAAIRKAIESEALKDFSPMEIGVFKQMLRRVVQQTQPA